MSNDNEWEDLLMPLEERLARIPTSNLKSLSRALQRPRPSTQSETVQTLFKKWDDAVLQGKRAPRGVKRKLELILNPEKMRIHKRVLRSRKE
jgi:hypothetical protein